MSIFTHTFPDYVKKQLELREEILTHGDTKKNRFDRHKAPGIPTLPAGAFYTNTIEKQCVLRLYSGVDLNDRGNDEILTTNEKNHWKREGLAANWILEGGIPLSDRADNLPAGPRSGFMSRATLDENGKPIQNEDGEIVDSKIGTSYGDPWTRSDAKEGYGIVPMPGIIDADIKTKSAYGSLREAKVNFVCHNTRQLEVLELLYMRPGYTLLLEWAWGPYIGNDGKKETQFPIINEFVTGKMKDNRGEVVQTTFSSLNDIVTKKIQDSSGNYDAMVGYCKNFEIKAREDGGYNCSTTIIAMGEILEALKGKRDFEPVKLNENEDEVLLDNFQIYLTALKQKMAGGKFPTQTDQDINWMEFTGAKDVADDFKKPDTGIPMAGASEHELTALDQAGRKILALPSLQLFERGKNVEPTEEEKEKLLETMSEAEILEDFAIPASEAYDALNSFYIHQGEPVSLLAQNDSTGEVESPQSKYNYVRWDLLVEILNNFVLESNEEDQVVKYSYRNNTESSNQDTNDYLEYSNYKFDPKTIIHLTSDWTGDTIPEEEVNAEDSNVEDNPGRGDTVSVDVESLIDGSMNPKICLLPHQFQPMYAKWEGKDYLFAETKFIHKDSRGVPQGTPTASEKSIGLVFLNLDYLLDKYKSMRFDDEGGDKEDWSIFKFLKEIWEEDITNSCAGTHKFVIHCPNNIARVIDISYGSDLDPDTLFNFKIQEKNAIVRDFNFHTTIDKKLSSTISIAAQSPTSISSLDQLSFAAFNKNIQNRFIKPESLSPEDIEKSLKKRQKLEKETNKLASEIYNHKRNMINGSEEAEKRTVSNAVSKCKKLEGNIIELTMTYSEQDEENGLISSDAAIYNDKLCVGSRKININMPKSSIIPLKFNAKMDGIGGIVIGNVFKVAPAKLPKGYRGKDIAFAVMSIGHKINNGQDWTTEIGGQLLLLDDPFTAGSTTFSLGSMGLTKDQAVDYAWNTHMVQHNISANMRYNNTTSPGIGDGTYSGAQGPDADWWTLISVVITEAHHHGVSETGGNVALFQQDCCDIAQSIFNRYQIDHLLNKTSTGVAMTDIDPSDLGGHSGTGLPELKYMPSFYGKTAVGDTLKSIMIAPNVAWDDADGVEQKGSGMAIAAYAVTYDPGFYGSTNPAGNNHLWSIISDKGSAYNALQSYYKNKGGISDKKLQRRIDLCMAALGDGTMMDDSRNFLGGRSEYRGTDINITSEHKNVTEAVLSGYDGTYGKWTMAELREVKVRDIATGNKFYYGYPHITNSTYPTWGIGLTAGPVPESIAKWVAVPGESSYNFIPLLMSGENLGVD